MAQQTQIKRIIELGVAQTNNNYRDQQLAIAAIAQSLTRYNASISVGEITDNSGGTDNSAAGAVPTPVTVAQDGTVLLAPKAGFDTQIGLIEDAHRELLTAANGFINGIVANTPGVATVRDLTSGAVVDGTIAAISNALTGSAAADQGVDAATGVAQIVAARNTQSAIIAALNWSMVALGYDVFADGSGGVFDKTRTEFTTTDAAATGTAAAAGENSLTVTSVNEALTALRDNIASIAALINAYRLVPDIGPFVVATHNPQTRFYAAQVSANPIP